MLRVFNSNLLGCSANFFGNPARERLGARHVFSAWRMLFTHPRQPILWEPGSQLDQRRPQPSMHIRDFSIDQFTDQDVGTIADGLSDAEYFATFGVPPPTSANRLTGNFRRETRHGAARSLKHDSMTLNECECLTACHCTSSQKPS